MEPILKEVVHVADNYIQSSLIFFQQSKPYEGSVLGPVLFLLYINDLKTSIEFARPTFFADDTSIFISGKSINNVQSNANITINKLTEWFDKNKLIINKEKTTALLFHPPQKVHLEYPLLKLQDTVINYSEHLKFLGVWLDNNLNWSTHTRELAHKLGKICFALRVVKRASGLETVCTLYHAYFQSLLSYGVLFWGNSASGKQIFRLQKRAIRAMMQIPKFISCKQYFKHLHILPLPCLYIYEVIVYMKSNLNLFTTNSKIHTYNTRNKDDLFIVPCNTSLNMNSFNNIGLRMLNHLPHHLREIPVSYKFKVSLKSF
jgi:hypothetical protein